MAKPAASVIDIYAGWWQAWFDGSALPNPGKMSVGIYLRAPDGCVHEYSKLVGSGCNNEAELLALCVTLEIATQNNVRQLVMRSDSDVAVQYVNGTRHTEIARLSTLIERAQALMAKLEQVSLLWVPRHRNLDADRLAREAFFSG